MKTLALLPPREKKPLLYFQVLTNHMSPENDPDDTDSTISLAGFARHQRNPVPVKSGSVQKQLPVSSDCCSVPAFQSSGRLQHAHTTDFRLRTSGSAPANERLPVTGNSASASQDARLPDGFACQH
ncbi:hypothetical protein I79_024974 [Cricetulus griseus]|uniref:Uncharacterized protein n=1 Tax=Cricetulus griseus TaxID=10029 RepID=G3IM44_CRIGR|nr:hypothetical protein I79_024974 [Cricetulus griseus]